MKKCPNCQHDNEDEAMVCDSCGHNLWDTITDETVIQKLPEGFPRTQIKSGWGTSTFEPQHQVIIHIRGHPDPIFVRPGNSELLLGRQQGPNRLDLTPFNALEKGVSRTHAALRRGDEMLFIVDMDSTNGTFLNEQPLTPHQPRVVRSGDEIRLGQLVLHVYFTGG